MDERFRCTDHQGRLVVMFEERWAHIVLGHPELIEQELAIAAVVARPDLVTRDNNFAYGENFYVLGVLPSYERTYLKVCVRYSIAEMERTPRGVIVTAHLCGAPRKSEVQIWP